MTLSMKLKYLRKHYPEILEAIKINAPNLIENPNNPSERDIDHYNFWIDAILDEDEAQPLYHFLT